MRLFAVPIPTLSAVLALVASSWPVVWVGTLLVAVIMPSTAPGQDGSDSIRKLTVLEAVTQALELSPALAILRDEPGLSDALALEERALFDPILVASIGRERVSARDLSSGGRLFDYRSDDLIAEASLVALMPVGTTLELGAASEVVDASDDGQQLVETRVSGELRQPLLRGSRKSANTARVTAARLEALSARHAADAGASALATLVEFLCWDLILAQEQVAVIESATKDALALYSSINDRVDSGTVPRTQLVAAESEIALRRQTLAEMRAIRHRSALYLAQYVAPADAVILDDLVLTDRLVAPDGLSDGVEQFVAIGLRDRPELAQTRALVKRGDVEVGRAKDGLLPQIDIWAQAALVGYGNASRPAWNNLSDDHWRVAFGVSIEQPLTNRDNRADYRRELVRRRQASASMAGLERAIETEVRVAHAEVHRSLEAIAAIRQTRSLDEKKLQVEFERFELGQASSFQVARAQRDLLNRRLDEMAAIAESRKALVELQRSAGSLLGRYGVNLQNARRER